MKFQYFITQLQIMKNIYFADFFKNIENQYVGEYKEIYFRSIIVILFILGFYFSGKRFSLLITNRRNPCDCSVAIHPSS